MTLEFLLGDLASLSPPFLHWTRATKKLEIANKTGIERRMRRTETLSYLRLNATAVSLSLSLRRIFMAQSLRVCFAPKKLSWGRETRCGVRAEKWLKGGKRVELDYSIRFLRSFKVTL